jgi:hypothetical protein
MATGIFQNRKGCIVINDTTGGAAKVSGSGLPESLFNDETPMFVNAIQVDDTDSVGKMACLSGKRILFVFGKGFGNVSVDINVIVGTGKSEGGNAGEIMESFNQNRVSTSENTSEITVKDGKTNFSVSFYLVRAVMRSVNPEIGLYGGTLYGVLVDD